jgi:excisionase family DNA binding protein
VFEFPRDLRGVDPQGAKPSLDDVMTAEQLALLLMRRSTVEDYARRGLLPSIKLGKHRRFVRPDVLAAIEELRLRPRSQAAGEPGRST